MVSHQDSYVLLQDFAKDRLVLDSRRSSTSGRGRAGRSPLPPGWQVARRLETFLPATLVRRRPVLVGRSLRTDRFSRTEVLAPGVAFMEISDGGTSVALGLPADHISLIIQDTGQADLALAAFPPGPEAQLMLRYLAANDLERGALLLPDLVRPTRFERIADEALLLGGYLAVRLGAGPRVAHRRPAARDRSASRGVRGRGPVRGSDQADHDVPEPARPGCRMRRGTPADSRGLRRAVTACARHCSCRLGRPGHRVCPSLLVRGRRRHRAGWRPCW